MILQQIFSNKIWIYPFYIYFKLEYMEQTLFMKNVLKHSLSYSRELMSAYKQMLIPQEGLQSMQGKIFEYY
jgi:hypothetical protein